MPVVGVCLVRMRPILEQGKHDHRKETLKMLEKSIETVEIIVVE